MAKGESVKRPNALSGHGPDCSDGRGILEGRGRQRLMRARPGRCMERGGTPPGLRMRWDDGGNRSLSPEKQGKREDVVTKERLKKLKALVKEAEHLQCQYDDLVCFPRERVWDSVKDYRTGRPHVLAVSGHGDPVYAGLRQKLYEKIRQVREEIAFLEGWLDSVEDPEMRDILRLLYAGGLTQEQAAEELGYSVITIKRRLKMFWEKNDY